MPTISVPEALELAGSSVPRAAALLWQLDKNRLDPHKCYQLDLQRNTRAQPPTTLKPLFKFWSGGVWQRRTYKSFKNLLSHFDQRSISLDTLKEEGEFLEAIGETDCIRFVHEWLTMHKFIPKRDMKGFVKLLMRLWFTDHVVDARRGTGFEHVFCGEIKRKGGRDRLNGLHNYVRVFLEEQYGNLRYMGYVDNIRHGKRKLMEVAPSPSQPMVTIRFELHGHQKHVSSMFFGVSPEFEFALYTLLAVANCQEVAVNYEHCRAKVKVITKNKKIKTAYPCLLEVERRLDGSFVGGRAVKRRRISLTGVVDLTGDDVVEVVDVDAEEVVDLTSDGDGEELKKGEATDLTIGDEADSKGVWDGDGVNGGELNVELTGEYESRENGGCEIRVNDRKVKGEERNLREEEGDETRLSGGEVNMDLSGDDENRASGGDEIQINCGELNDGEMNGNGCRNFRAEDKVHANGEGDEAKLSGGGVNMDLTGDDESVANGGDEIQVNCGELNGGEMNGNGCRNLRAEDKVHANGEGDEAKLIGGGVNMDLTGDDESVANGGDEIQVNCGELNGGEMNGNGCRNLRAEDKVHANGEGDEAKLIGEGVNVDLTGDDESRANGGWNSQK